MLNKIVKIYKSNKAVVKNILGAFIVKGGALIVSLFTMPAYLHFFYNQTILGVWFTILSVLNWVLYFDLGLGNGLRNLLPKAITQKDKKAIKEIISTTYITMTTLVIVLSVIGLFTINAMNWNSVLNVGTELVDNATLKKCVGIVYAGIMLQFVLKLVTSTLYALQKSAVVNFMTLSTSIITLLALYVIPSKSLEENLITMAIVNVIAALLPNIIASFFVYGKELDNSYPRFRWFNYNLVPTIMKIGLSLLWLQLVFMVVSSTNEFLISKLTSPDFVVDYQAYFKIFKTGSMIFTLALSPIWSAVTKAQAEKNYLWIKKTYKFFLWASLGCMVLELIIIPFLQPLMDLWLGKGIIDVSVIYALVFALSGTVFVVHNVNTSIENGISCFKTQMIWMTFAAIVDIPLSYIFVRITGRWISIVVANILVLLPYEIIAPIHTMKELDKMSVKIYK